MRIFRCNNLTFIWIVALIFADGSSAPITKLLAEITGTRGNEWHLLTAGAFISIWGEGQEPVVIDGNVEMPGRGLDPDRFGRGVAEVTFAWPVGSS